MPLLPASSLRRSRDLISIVSAGSLSALALLVAATPRVATAQTVASPTTGWYANTSGGVIPTDPVKDNQTGQPPSDIVGDATNPFMYTLFDNAGTTGVGQNTDGTLYFRLRLTEGGAAFTQTALIGLSFTSNVSNQPVINLFVGVDNSGGGDRLVIFGSDTTKANISPSTSGVDSKQLLFTYTETANNYYYAPVSAVNQPTPGSPFNFGSGVNQAGGPDYFLGFAIPFADIVSAANTVGVPNVTDTTNVRFIAFTSAQPNQLNQDFGGSGDPAAPFGPTNISDPNSPSNLLPTPAPPGVVSGLIGIAMGGAQFGMMKFRTRRRPKKAVVTEDAGSEM